MSLEDLSSFDAWRWCFAGFMLLVLFCFAPPWGALCAIVIIALIVYAKVQQHKEGEKK
jgi:hypothetical protein